MQKPTVIGDAYNIAPVVVQQAEIFGLGAISTGGGCDYICRQIDETRIMVLGSANDADSPDNLQEAANVTLYTSEDWTEGVSFNFASTSAALHFMSGFDSVVVLGEEQPQWWRAEAMIDGIKEPFVDWFKGATQEDAHSLWVADAEHSGVPVKKARVRLRLATEKEAAICDKVAAAKEGL